MKKLLILLIATYLLLFFIPTNSSFAQDATKVHFYIFYSDDCEHCEVFREFILPDIQERYNIEFKEFEISDDENFELLIKFEAQYGQENDVPVIFIGDKVIGGDDVDTDLENIISEYSKTGCPYPKLEKSEEKDTNAVDLSDDSKPIYIAYFFKVGCKYCDHTVYALKTLKKRYPQLEIREYEINSSESMRLNEALCQLYEVPEKYHQATPMLFVGETFLIEENANFGHIESIIKMYRLTGTEAPWNRVKHLLKDTEKNIIDRFVSFGIFTIVVAGLIDGINPCAFATIIFFVSYLSLLGRKGRDVLYIGSAYTIAVFTSYFSIGILGLSVLEVLQKLRFLSVIVDAIFLITGGIVIILAGYSIYDFYLYKKGKTADMVLQLPKSIKQKIHKVIRKKSRTTHFVLAAFVIGFLVSCQELFCTGQVYLPTLIYMSRLSQYRTWAYIYLVLYNLLFILPLVAVFLLVYWGVTSLVIAKWVEKNLGTMKILMALIFFALGIILIGSVIIWR